MRKRPFFILPIATIVLALSPISAFANSGALDELSRQITGTSTAGNSFVEGGPTLTLDDLRKAQAAQNSFTAQENTQQPYWSNATTPPNPINTVSARIDTTLDPNRLIDPVTGRINGAIDGVTGRVNSAINRTLDSLLSPVDTAINGAFDQVDTVIDTTIASIMAPVDNIINNVMAGIDRQIESLLGGLLEGEGGIDSVLNEVTGGVFSGIFGNENQRITVAPAYNPTSPLSSIITATSFTAALEGVSAPYTETIPFAMGSMGLPDYSKIMPTLDVLAKGENGNPNPMMQGMDRFSTTPETLKMSLSGEIERIASRSIAQSTLSEAGQEDMKAQLDGAAKTLETIVAIGDASQDLDVTQDVMKSLTAQLANDSVIRAGQYKQDLLARQQAAADAVVNAEIARLLGEQTRANRADMIANAARMHTVAGQLHLPGEMPDE
ncbi:MAG: hypothetical protein AB8B99_17650 [Phormidesmis sp.]